MGDGTHIQWTDASWNPVVGCSHVSAGCDNCYAGREARRHDRPGSPYEGTTAEPRDKAGWSGLVRIRPEKVDEPLRWTKPRRIFVNSMSDLFHPTVPRDFIERVWDVMRRCPQHTFQILTKRPGRMRLLLADRDATPSEVDAGCELGLVPGIAYDNVLPNVWLGVSVEDQHAADTRIPELLRVPAAVRFLSVEPLIGPVNLEGPIEYAGWLEGIGSNAAGDEWITPSIGWVIVGGESGPGARPLHVEWVRRIVQQCATDDVPVFVKQLGANVWHTGSSGPGKHPVAHTVTHDQDEIDGRMAFRLALRDRKGGNPDEWPEDLRVRDMPQLAHEALV